MPAISTKLTFALGSDEKSRKLPSKIVVSQSQNEKLDHVLLKALAFVIFHSDRIVRHQRQFATVADSLYVPLSVGRTGQCWDNALHRPRTAVAGSPSLWLPAGCRARRR